MPVSDAKSRASKSHFRALNFIWQMLAIQLYACHCLRELWTTGKENTFNPTNEKAFMVPDNVSKNARLVLVKSFKGNIFLVAWLGLEGSRAR